jgi:hypothetical protein
MKITGCQTLTVQWMAQYFPTKLLQQVPSLLCCLKSGMVMEENHTIAKGQAIFS